MHVIGYDPFISKENMQKDGIEKIEKLVNWSPKLSVEESIKRYIKWLEKNI